MHPKCLYKIGCAGLHGSINRFHLTLHILNCCLPLLLHTSFLFLLKDVTGGAQCGISDFIHMFFTQLIVC